MSGMGNPINSQSSTMMLPTGRTASFGRDFMMGAVCVEGWNIKAIKIAIATALLIH